MDIVDEAGSFEMSIAIYQSTRRNILEASNLYQHRFENLKSRITQAVFSLR